MRDQAAKETDAGKRDALLQQASDLEANWKEGGFARVVAHTAVGAMGGGVNGALGAAASAGSAELMNELQAAVQQKLEESGMGSGVAGAIAQGIAGLTATGIGAAVGGTAGAATAFNADFNNRQLHQNEIALAKKYGKLLASKEKNLSEEQAIARIERQILRWTNYETFVADGGKVDEAVVSTIGISGRDPATGMKWDYRNFAQNHPDEYYNSSINQQNISLYSPLLASTNAGLTPQQIVDRNDAAGAPIAKVGVVVLGAYVLAPAAAALALEVQSFYRLGPLAYCGLFPNNCLTAAETVAGIATGTPTPGMSPSSGTAGMAANEAKAVNVAQQEAKLAANIAQQEAKAAATIAQQDVKAGAKGKDTLLDGASGILDAPKSIEYIPPGSVVMQPKGAPLCGPATCNMVINDAKGTSVDLNQVVGQFQGIRSSGVNINEMNAVLSQNGVLGKTTTTLSIDQLNVALANGKPVIVGVPAGTGNHFIIVDSTKTIDNITYYMTRDPFVGPRGVRSDILTNAISANGNAIIVGK